EDDPTLRDRLRNAPDALTRASILAAVNATLLANGITDPAGLVELPKHGAHSRTWTLPTGTGGTFAVAGTTVTFTPAVLPWPRKPYRSPVLVPFGQMQLFLSGCANAANNGLHVITGLDGNAAVWTDASAVAGIDASCSWQLRTYNAEGFLQDGEGRAFSRGGYRSARLVPLRIVIILPFGSTAGIEASVREALRTKKAAGIAVTVERRTIAP
ncbi:MAG TPA: hypothetical protein VMZ53_03510, partial [Kofleriaceae bacterium]|nr:hypothetical protein [Kofleriaceae bacterium]